MKSFDKTAARMVGDQIEKELVALGKKLGLEFAYGGGSFSLTEMTLKVRVVPADKEVVQKKEADDFKSYAALFGFDEKDYKRVYDFKGRGAEGKYEILGFNLNRPKFAIKGRNIATGKISLFPAKQVKLQFYPERRAEIMQEVE